MILELTDEEAAVIDAGLVEVADAYGRLAFALHGRKLRYRGYLKNRIATAERLRGKLLVAKYGEKRAAEIAAEREAVPTLEELYNGEPVRDAAADRKPDAGSMSARLRSACALADKLTVERVTMLRHLQGAADRKPDAGAEDRDGGEPANGDTRPPCYADNGNAPYCAGVDCAAWGDCHGDRLRGVADCTGARR